MKKFAGLLFVLMAFVFTAQAQSKIKFDTDSHDFGTINEGVQATYEFTFENVGDEPLVITQVRPSCGCTTPEWSKEPIQPGDEGVIKAIYNSKGRPGRFHKSITVYTNEPESNTKVIFIKGEVKPQGAPADQSPVRVPNQ